jgi:hypothetical protein
MTSIERQVLSRPWWLLPLGRVDSSWWWLAGVGLVVIDYAAGAETQFPLVYAVPVILAAWYSGRGAALTLASVLPLVHLLFVATWWRPEHWGAVAATTAARGVVVLLIALWFDRLAAHEAAVSRHLEAIEGLLPICAFCKSIRNDDGEWERLEAFISRRSDARFSHGFCPACRDAHYPDLAAATDGVGRRDASRADWKGANAPQRQA